MRNANGSMSKLEKRLEILERLLDINSYEVHYASDKIKVKDDAVLIRLRWVDIGSEPIENLEEVDILLSENP
jgi:hypothetical protein